MYHQQAQDNTQPFCKQTDEKTTHWENELLSIIFFLDEAFKKLFQRIGVQLQCPCANDLQLQKILF